MSGWIKAGNLLEKVKNRLGRGLGEVVIKQAYQAVAPAGEPVFYDRRSGELLVEVQSSAVSQMLHFRSLHLIEQINKRLNNDPKTNRQTLRRLRFRVRR